MPLEEVFSKVKSIIKANDEVFQSTTISTALLTMAFGMVTSEECNDICTSLWLCIIFE